MGFLHSGPTSVPPLRPPFLSTACGRKGEGVAKRERAHFLVSLTLSSPPVTEFGLHKNGAISNTDICARQFLQHKLLHQVFIVKVFYINVYRYILLKIVQIKFTSLQACFKSFKKLSTFKIPEPIFRCAGAVALHGPFLTVLGFREQT